MAGPVLAGWLVSTLGLISAIKGVDLSLRVDSPGVISDA